MFSPLHTTSEIYSGMKRKRNGSGNNTEGTPFTINALILTLLDKLRKISALRDNGVASVTGNVITISESTTDSEFLSVMADDAPEENDRGRIECLLWEYTSDVINNSMSSCREDKELLIGILTRVLESLQSYPIGLSLNEMKSVTYGIRILTQLCSTTNNYIPNYLVTAHISNIINNTVHPSPPAIQMTQSPPMLPRDPGVVTGYVHWALCVLLRGYINNKQSLASMMVLADCMEICRVTGTSKEEDSYLKRDINIIHRIYQDDPTNVLSNSSNNTKRNASLTSMLREGAPHHVIKSQLMLNSELRNWYDNGSKEVKYNFSESVVTAFTNRSRGLLSSIGSNESKDDAWWYEWQHFADQFYTVVDCNILDIEKYLHILYRNQKSEPNTYQNNALIWLINQCIPLEQTQKLIRDDHSQNKPILITLINNFSSTSQSESEYRDYSFICTTEMLIQTISNISTTSDQRRIMDSYTRSQGNKIKGIKQWWDLNKNNQFSALLNEPRNIPFICTASFVLRDQIVNSVMSSLQQNETLSTFPNNSALSFVGRVSPFPLNIITKMSIKSRCQIFDALDNIMFKQAEGNSTGGMPISPGILDMYVRLLYLSTDPRKSFEPFLDTLRSSRDLIKLQTLIEAINFRLIRFIKYNNLCMDVFRAILPLFGWVINHQLFSNLEILMFNIIPMINIHKMVDLPEVNFGEVINRALLPLLIPGMKSGWGDTHISDPGVLIRRIVMQLPNNNSLINIISLFPPSLLRIYNNAINGINDIHRNNPNVSRDEVKEEHTATRQLGSAEQLLSHYNANPNKRAVILCLLWHMVKDPKKPNSIEAFYRMFLSFPPQDIESCTFIFVNFIMEELPSQSTSKSNGTGRGQQVVNETVNQLIKFVWVYKLIQFETLIMALLSKLSTDTNVVILIERLVSESSYWLPRIDMVHTINLSKEFWLDDSTFMKSSELNSRTPDTRMMLPVYYSNIAYRILPVLDYTFCRMIEAGEPKIITKMVETYHKLYTNFHNSPAEFVLNTFYIYYENPIMNQDLKLNLLKLLDPAAMSFSDSFKAYQAKPENAESLFGREYFDKTIISGAGNVIQMGHMQSLGKHSPFHMFEEFPTHIQACMTSSLLELLTIPVDVSSHLIATIFKQRNLFGVMAAGMIMSSLPNPLRMPIIQKSAQIFNNERLFMGDDLSSTISLSFANDFHSNMNTYIYNDYNRIMLLLQTYINHSSIDAIEIVHDTFNACRPFKSLQQLYFICKLFGPFMHRLQGTKYTMRLVVRMIFNCIQDLDNIITDLLWDMESTQPDTHPISLFNLVVDYVHHIHYSFPKLIDHINDPELYAVYQAMSPDLANIFKHIFTLEKK